MARLVLARFSTWQLSKNVDARDKRGMTEQIS
jgi:hypothetical protein